MFAEKSGVHPAKIQPFSSERAAWQFAGLDETSLTP
jgi:hypothetical protein